MDPGAGTDGFRGLSFLPALGEQPLMHIQGHAGLFLALGGQITAPEMRGDLTPAINGTLYALQDFASLQLNDSGTAAFQALLCCGQYVSGILLSPPALPFIPNGEFAAPGDNGLPVAWTTSWTNSGSAEAFHYLASDAYSGAAAPRLHVQAGGGSVFVLSDPIAASLDTPCLLECRMRFNFDSSSDAGFFSVIQIGSQGEVVGFDEVRAIRGESQWTWILKRIFIYTAPGTTYLQIGFGLSSNQEKYLDVDALH